MITSCHSKKDLHLQNFEVHFNFFNLQVSLYCMLYILGTSRYIFRGPQKSYITESGHFLCKKVNPNIKRIDYIIENCSLFLIPLILTGVIFYLKLHYPLIFTFQGTGFYNTGLPIKDETMITTLKLIIYISIWKFNLVFERFDSIFIR